jgi:hypothetical protein
MKLVRRPVAVTFALLGLLTRRPIPCDAQSSPSGSPVGVCDLKIAAFKECQSAEVSSDCSSCLAKYQKTNTTQLTCSEWKTVYCTYASECKAACPCAADDATAASCLFSNCKEVDPSFCATDGQCQPFNCPTSSASRPTPSWQWLFSGVARLLATCSFAYVAV